MFIHIRPVALLLAVLVALPWVNPMAYGPSPTVQPWLTTALCSIGMWVLAGTPRALISPFSAWLPAFVLAALWSRGGWAPEVVFLAAGLALVSLGMSVGRATEHAPSLQAGLLIAACISAAIGLFQYAGFAVAPMAWITPAEAGTAVANLRQTNHYATLCWIGVVVLAFGALRLPRHLQIGLAVTLGFACSASGSRTAFVQALVAMLLAGSWPGQHQRSRLVLCGCAAAAYLVGSWVLPWLLELFGDASTSRLLWTRLGGSDGCASRLVLWSNVLYLVSDRPLAGWGWGNLDLAHYAAAYSGPRFCEILDNAHNLPLHMAVELGVPAAILLCGAALVWVLRKQPWQEHGLLPQLGWAVIALVAVHSLLEYPLWYGPFQVTLGLAIGWLSPPVAPPARADSPRLMFAGVLLAVTAFAAWDYARVSQIYQPPAERWSLWRENALEHARRSWLFSGPARFADVTLAETTRVNAQWMYDEANLALHYSPEPRVIERVIESAVMLGRDDEALLHLARYRAAFPAEYAAWQQRQRRPSP